jgi:5-methylcytosine-specific restriction endonuclease McrA
MSPPAAVTPDRVRLGLDGVASPRPTASAAPAVVLPLAPARYKVQFTASQELHDKLARLRDLMRSKVPDADLAAIIEEAVTEKLERLEARRFGRTKAPRKQLTESDTSTGSRYIPAAVKRAVSERDERQCHHRHKDGRRCPARARLEYHHRHPFAFGGDNAPHNLVLLCPLHHGLQSEHDFGPSGRRRRTAAAPHPHSP